MDQDALGDASVEGAASDGLSAAGVEGSLLGAVSDGAGVAAGVHAPMAPAREPARTMDSRMRFSMWRVPP